MQGLGVELSDKKNLSDMFVDNGIEIPYNYVNLVVKKESEDA